LAMLLFGSGSMLFAMNKRKSKVAQESFLKFQYSIMGLVVGSMMQSQRIPIGPEFDLTLNLLITCLSILYIIGAFAVLGAFKKNHPLNKILSNNALDDSLTQDFLEQNRAVGAELSKYDKQLDTMGFLLFRWWLKFMIVYEIARISHALVFITNMLIIKSKPKDLLVEFLAVILTCIPGIWSALDLESAITIKLLSKSKRAIVLCKVYIGMSIITFLCLGKNRNAHLVLVISESWPISLVCFVYCCVLPSVNLFAARSVFQVLEQREKFADASSFHNESYL